MKRGNTRGNKEGKGRGKKGRGKGKREKGRKKGNWKGKERSACGHTTLDAGDGRGTQERKGHAKSHCATCNNNASEKHLRHTCVITPVSRCVHALCCAVLRWRDTLDTAATRSALRCRVSEHWCGCPRGVWRLFGERALRSHESAESTQRAPTPRA